jgi:hypothetical protein
MAASEARIRAQREAGMLTRKQAGRQLLDLAEMRFKYVIDQFVLNLRERQRRTDELVRGLSGRQP